MKLIYKSNPRIAIVVIGAVFSILTIAIGRRFLLQRPAVLSNVNYKTEEAQKLSDKHEKRILLWTKFFNDPLWRNFFPKLPATLTYSSDKKCLVMAHDQLPVGEADAVVFHGPDLNDNAVPYLNRTNSQRWIYFALESAFNLHFIDQTEIVKSLNKLAFNWTMSNSRLSDVWFPYGKFRPRIQNAETFRETKANIGRFKDMFSKREHDAIWIVSNCRTQSWRELLTSKLQGLGVDVHFVGKCYNGVEYGKSVASLDYSKYRYYFSFENSLCDEYVTEKVYQGYGAAVQAGVIPVLFGASSATYEAILPRNSYIDVTSFKNVFKLGEFLRKLSANNETYYQDMLTKFYEWHLTSELHCYIMNFTTVHAVSQCGFPALCEKLWTVDDSSVSVIEDVSKHFGLCRTPASLAGGSFFNWTSVT